MNLPNNLSNNTSVVVQDTTISCEGQGNDVGATSGHPRVFIKINTHTNSADCPYCGQNFTMDPNAKVSGGH
ncbi:MAG: zinc-finger domain-containing protein [Rhodospirillaceae bacterium]|nr:zinc-finger domain-containing protein [Rhodospirillaceae bacterium]